MKKVTKFQQSSHSERGFALVVAVMMLMLLSLIAVGMLGLASVETRSSSRSNAMNEARANARLALSIAIAQLQKNVGPDQRITGETHFGGSQNNASIPHPRWTGVWKSTMPDDGSVIRRDGQNGGLRDRRYLEDWDADDEMLTQLVSGNEAKLIHRADEEGSTEMMELLVGPGSVGGDTNPDDTHVHAPRVQLVEDAKPVGEYAWWVGDLGIKANVATPDRFEGASGNEIRQLQIAQDQSLSAVTGLADIPSSERAKLVTPAQVELSTGKKGVLKPHFHDFTTDSESILVDVRDGGLKKDLTAYLTSSGSIPDLGNDGLASLGLSDTDRLIGPANDRAADLLEDGDQADRLSMVSPTFKLLRHWAIRAPATPFSKSKMFAAHPETRPMENGKISSYSGDNHFPVEYKNRSLSDVSPVLAEGSVYYNISYYDTGDTQPGQSLGLRLHLYPRVALWNPYNIALELEPSMISMQINGSKQIEVTLANKQTQAFQMSWGQLQNEYGSWDRWRRGTHYFRLDGVTIEPGETLVFSPARNQQYDESNFAANQLTPNLPPDPSRSFFLDKRSDGDPLFDAQQTYPPTPGISANRLASVPLEWREFVPPKPQGSVQASGYTQADNYYMYWKPIKGTSSNHIDLRDFGDLPHGRFVNCSLQYGDEDELPVEWSSRDPVPLPKSDTAGVTLQTPDRRTRDGFRLRWFEEHPSNLYGSGSLAGTPHLQTAPIANWNVRASYSFRSNFENVTDIAPHFFGVYTRDLFDDAVNWSSMTPRSSGGLQLGDAFNQPISGVRRILFDLPREGAEVVSLGAFQHLKFSEFIWHPTYAFGNSIADPRIDLTMTEPNFAERINNWEGGWNRDTIGYTTDGRSNNPNTYNSDSWAHHARGLLEQTVQEQNVIFDLSYELNHSLWDRYFLSTGSSSEKKNFMEAPDEYPLPNGRFRLQPESELADLNDYHRAAATLTLDGGFNVNSTNPLAWESLLLSAAGVRTGPDSVMFPRILKPKEGEWNGVGPHQTTAWSGQRVLKRDEVRTLAEAIVEEVRRRGPFLSLSDFVNRRLRDDETGLSGTLEAAITRAGINQSFEQIWPLNNHEELPDFNHPDNIKDPTRINQTAKPNTTAWGALGHLTQADLLQSLGPVLTARSDSFVVRAYGNSLDPSGKVVAEAWCEAVVQRTIDPVNPDNSGLNSDPQAPIDFGRRFVTKRFRWLSREEI
ncbi:hypothetical protein ACFQY0_11570 [Haloferula chungangensis]|uniref:Uncharacterized protein n=1 Tax=Haloferula chungangensis TaxID=1048331 RepID=A0ABW2L985_9BACT